MDFPSWSGAATPETAAATFRVSGLDGQAHKLIKLTKANTVLGRKSDLCTVVIDHHTVSRRHAVVMHRGDGTLHLLDLGSAQGTRINGQQLGAKVSSQLSDGDTVHFGQDPRTFKLSLPRATEAESDSLRAQLPMGFGSAAAPPATPPASGDDGRRRREEEIAAMTASLMGPATFTAHAQRGEPAAEVGAREDAPRVARKRDAAVSAAAAEEEEEEVSPEERIRKLGLPVSHEVSLAGHDKAVLSLAMDPAGGRILSGSLDYKVKFWDFGG